MGRTMIISFAVASFFTLLMPSIADLNGKWSGTIQTQDGDQFQAVYDFKVDGSRLSGTVSSPAGTVPIDSRRVEGNKFFFQVTVDGNDYLHKGTLYDDSCGVDIDVEGQTIHTTLLRDTAK